jgi:hypothetical protein
MELAYTFRIIGDLIKTPSPIYRFLAQLMHEWKSASLIFEQLHVVHLHFYTTLPNDSLMGFYANDEEAVIAECFHAKRPSRFLSGLRQFKSAILVMDDPRALRFTKQLAELLTARLDRFRHIYPVALSEVRVLTTLVLQPMYSSLHQAVYDGLAGAVTVPPSAAYFTDCLSWIPTAIRAGTDASRIIRSLNLFLKVRSPMIFSLASRILNEQIKAAPPRQRDAIAMDACFTFLSDHSDHQSYYTGKYLRTFADIFAGLGGDTLFYFCINSAKAVRFLPVFMCLVVVVARAGKGEWTARLIEGLLGTIEVPQHRQAIEALRDGPLTREAFELACVAREK